MPSTIRVPAIAFATLALVACSGDAGGSPTIVGNWSSTVWKDVSVADTSLTRNLQTDGNALQLTFTATGAFTQVNLFPDGVDSSYGSYALHGSTLTMTYSATDSVDLTALVSAASLTLSQPADSEDFGRGPEPARTIIVFARQ